MKIVLITESYLPYISGVASSSHSIARALADFGHDVTVVTPKSKRYDASVDHEQGIRVLRTWAIPDPNYAGRMVTPLPIFLPQIDRAITKDTDIVHIQEPTSIGLYAYARARRVGVPVVGALHLTPDQVMRMVPWFPYSLGIAVVEAYLKWRYNKYDSIMVPTQTFVDFLRRIGVKAPAMVISNGVNVRTFQPVTHKEALRSALRFPKNATLFLVLSRLDKDKFVEDAVGALPMTQKGVRLIVAGVGPEEARLHALAQKLKVTDRITWIGKVNEKEMVDLYGAVDAFIMMGIYEVQSIVTLQAVATGLPILAVRAGALPELCHDTVNGFLVDPHDSQALAKRMDELARHSDLRKAMGIKSREISLVHDKLKAMKRVETWYKEVITAQMPR